MFLKLLLLWLLVMLSLVPTNSCSIYIHRPLLIQFNKNKIEILVAVEPVVVIYYSSDTDSHVLLCFFWWFFAGAIGATS